MASFDIKNVYFQTIKDGVVILYDDKDNNIQAHTAIELPEVTGFVESLNKYIMPALHHLADYVEIK